MNRILVIISVILSVVTILLGYLLFKTSSENYDNNQSLREGNEQIYKELAKATNSILFNSDVMMRFSHYQNNHDPEVKQQPLCPECVSPNRFEQEIDPAWIDLPEDGTVYQTVDAILDTQEIAEQIQRLTGSLVNQRHKLEYTSTYSR